MLLVQAQAAAKGNLLPTKGKGKQKKAATNSKAGSKAAAADLVDNDEADVLQDYQLSDDSDMEG